MAMHRTHIERRLAMRMPALVLMLSRLPRWIVAPGPRPLRDSQGVGNASNHRFVSVLAYRQLINRDLPKVERSCTSKAMFISRREAVSSTRRGHRGDGALHPY